ncbi:uncharacterized protein LOC143635398 [Bidens hawaiensis]|uniref:uncharacterized protein LOC143635398 n=1 Tax=Bidens hawaiensis TaxID=980011 RepID=UPI004049D703
MAPTKNTNDKTNKDVFIEPVRAIDDPLVLAVVEHNRNKEVWKNWDSVVKVEEENQKKNQKKFSRPILYSSVTTTTFHFFWCFFSLLWPHLKNMKNASIKNYFGKTPKPSIETPSSSSHANENNNKRSREEVEVSEDEIVGDPALRKPINDYSINIREEVRRRYITKEYSASKDAAFCLWCYLFPTGNRHGDEVFINHSFRNWKKAFENFRDHEGGQNSRHNHARVQFELFKDQRHNLDNVLSQQCKQDEIIYRVRLTAVVDVIRFLLKQGLAFRGHDESISSNSRGNFLELVKWYCERNNEVNKAFNSKLHGNNQLTLPKIQKEIVNACAAEVRKIIVNEVKDKFFSILIDESCDCSIKEQMAVVLRYVDDGGEVIERFVGVVHVTDTCASSLKGTIDNFFAKNNLTMSKVRGQGYDGASNMRGELNGLKQKFLAENKFAFYIHCFAHRLQLVVVATSSEYASVSSFFDWLTKIVNIAGASSYVYIVNEHQHANFVYDDGEDEAGRCKFNLKGILVDKKNIMELTGALALATPKDTANTIIY